jgi:hypothetical protein
MVHSSGMRQFILIMSSLKTTASCTNMFVGITNLNHLLYRVTTLPLSVETTTNDTNFRHDLADP